MAEKDEDVKLHENDDGSVIVGGDNNKQDAPEDESVKEPSENESEVDEEHSEEDTEEERAAKTERNRQRRKDAKERRKDYVESLKRDLAARDHVINEMNQRLAVVERKSSGSEMAQFLLRKGRRRAGYVGALARADIMGQARLEGFRTTLARADHALVDAEILQDSPAFYAGYYGLETLLARTRDLDVVYFHNDEMAIGGLAYCQTRGLRVPEDIGIAGWGGMEAASILPRRLTTTVVPTTAIGKAAAEALVARLKGEAGQDVTVIPTRLVPGETA